MKPATPLPWHTVKDKVAPYSGIYADADDQVTHENGATSDKDAAYIVHAANAYQELVSALCDLLDAKYQDMFDAAKIDARALLAKLGEAE